MSALSFTIGDVRVTRIEELYSPLFPLEMVLPIHDADALAESGGDLLPPVSQDGLLIVSIHAWLVQTPQKTIVIDTCTGNDKQRPDMPPMHELNTPFLKQLREAGVNPEDVDAVVCTHLHMDHVGWNTSLVDGEWVPTFPNATYHFNKTEFDFWQAEPDDEAQAANLVVFGDSVAPVFDRGLVELWDGDGVTIDESLRLELAPGHTPGHAIGWLESGGERGMFSGDAMHSAIQALRPDWSSGFCVDFDQSASTRKAILDRTAEHNAILMPAHFAAPHACRLKPHGEGFLPLEVETSS